MTSLHCSHADHSGWLMTSAVQGLDTTAIVAIVVGVLAATLLVVFLWSTIADEIHWRRASLPRSASRPTARPDEQQDKQERVR